jgi:Protein of unknown function (DUF3106)
MKRVKIICGLALALLMGLVAQPALAQKPHASTPSHPPGMHAGPHQGGAHHPNRNANQAGRPHPGTAHPPNAVHPPAVNPNVAHAQENARENEHSPANPNNPGANAGADREGRGLGGLTPSVKQKLQDMSPQEQDRFLQNNERFKSLPPQRQAQLRNNLKKWNNLSPTERNAMSDRQRAWERMSPEKRQYVQSTLLPKWQQMSPERKQLVTGRLHTLQGMSATERQAALDDPQFMRGLNPDEQSVLRGLDSLNAPSHP